MPVRRLFCRQTAAALQALLHHIPPPEEHREPLRQPIHHAAGSRTGFQKTRPLAPRFIFSWRKGLRRSNQAPNGIAANKTPRALRRAAGRLFKRWKPQELLFNGNDIQLRYGGVIPSLRLTEGGEAEIARLDGRLELHFLKIRAVREGALGGRLPFFDGRYSSHSLLVRL